MAFSKKKKIREKWYVLPFFFYCKCCFLLQFYDNLNPTYTLDRSHIQTETCAGTCSSLKASCLNNYSTYFDC